MEATLLRPVFVGSDAEAQALQIVGRTTALRGRLLVLAEYLAKNRLPDYLDDLFADCARDLSLLGEALPALRELLPQREDGPDA